MPIVFLSGWDVGNNHTSGRSQQEVEAIIREVALPNFPLVYDHSEGGVGIAVAMDHRIEVEKGIHDDSRGKHITVFVTSVGQRRMYHLYLNKDQRRPDNSFIWRVQEIR